MIYQTPKKFHKWLLKFEVKKTSDFLYHYNGDVKTGFKDTIDNNRDKNKFQFICELNFKNYMYRYSSNGIYSIYDKRIKKLERAFANEILSHLEYLFPDNIKLTIKL